MEIEVDNLVEGYIEVCLRVLQDGADVTVRDMVTRELTGVTLVFDNPCNDMLPRNVGRGVSPKLAAVEALCMIAGDMRPRMIVAAAPTFTDVLVSGVDHVEMMNTAYGPRIADQLSDVIWQLKSDPTTRQAILQIWRPTDLTRNGDKPCTIMQQFMIRRNRLECHTYMRSQDVWLGLAVDAFVFTQLQQTVANFMELEVGKYVHHVGSFHAYARDWDKITNLSPRVIDHAQSSLPFGVVTGGWLPQDVAHQLLDDKASKDLQVLNPWYVKQISAVYQSMGVTP